MGIEKLEILGNEYIGAWVTATDRFFLMGNEVSRGEERILKEALGVEGFRARISGTGFVGIYAAMNSNGVLLPYGTEDHELAELKLQLHGFNVEILHTDYNALRNNILVNDKLAVVNPSYGKNEEKAIADALQVEVVKAAVGGFSTVGANNIMTNKGLVINNRATEQEKEMLEEMVGMKSEQSTANLGSVSIGLCTVANSKGLVVGDTTTGFELSRIAEALNID
ncbi:MAG: translation initiation factor IF-6 [Candidatus Micrarchaeota archaeon]|nr:translation initiation factor IF-6 [Candidatus Micrarchaeota archaeon]